MATDWDDLRVFLAVARAGSLSAAGAALGLDPATVGRRIARLEHRHAAALFGPPSERRFWLKSSGLLERYGRRLSSSLAGGVFLAEASKQLQTPGGTPVKTLVRDPCGVLDAVNAPTGPEPA